MGRGAVVLALVLVVLLVLMSGCADVSFGSQQLGDFGNSPEEKAAVNDFKNKYGDPLTNSGPPRFLEPMVSTGLVNNTPVDRVTKFSEDTGSIWFWVFYDNFKKGDPLTLTWTYNGKTIISLNRQAGGDFGRAFGEFLKPNSGWATGTHTITISGSGTSAAATFDIVDGRTETVPLPYAGELSGSGSVIPVPTQTMNLQWECLGEGFTPCDDGCFYLANDPDNCGTCDTKCPSPQVCVYGQCSDSCEPATDAWLKYTGAELRNCDRHCVDTQSDVENCGGCGKKCGSGEICRGGTCTRLQTCGSVRIGTLDNPAAASRIRNEVASGNIVVVDIGSLRSDKVAYERVLYELKGLARDVDGDIIGVGDQRVVIVTPSAMKISRMNLDIGENCGTTGKTECSGACVDLTTDVNNCGACGTVCTGTEKCCDGLCRAGGCLSPVPRDMVQRGIIEDLELGRLPICATGQFICGGVCSYLQTDESNCGRCGNVCSRGQGCCQGTCKDILFDNYNCGGCGNVCPMTPRRTTCDAGECR